MRRVSINLKEGRAGSGLLFNLRRDRSGTKSRGERSESFPLLHALYGCDAELKSRRVAPSEAQPLRDELHLLCSNPDRLKDRVLMGEMKKTNLRSLRWRLLLGSLSRDWRSWACDVQTQREQYALWRAQYLVNPRGPLQRSTTPDSGAAAPAAPSPPPMEPATPPERERERGDADDPLSQNEQSTWNQFFKTTQLHREIHEDVIRTYPDNEFFLRQEVIESMERVLFVYAMLNPQLRYVQGMNEVLAPLLYVVHHDYHRIHSLLNSPLQPEGSVSPAPVPVPAATLPPPPSTPPPQPPAAGTSSSSQSPAPDSDDAQAALRVLQETSRLEYIEHDSYWLFSQLMSVIGEWFLSPKATDITPENAVRTAPRAQNFEHVKVVSKCQQIQALLSIKDPELASYLIEMDIQPQLYMLRWVRIMFSQVFALEDLVLLWDAIFAAGPPFQMVDAICVTMLMLVRGNIISEDYSTILDLLFHYPRTHSPNLIVAIALNVLLSPSTPFFLPTSSLRLTSPSPVPPNSPATITSAPATPTQQPPLSPRNGPLSPTQAQQPPQMMMQELSVLSHKKQVLPATGAPATKARQVQQQASSAAPDSWSPAAQKIQKMPLGIASQRRGPGAAQQNFSLEPESAVSAADWDAAQEKLASMKTLQQHLANRLERVLYTLGTISGATVQDQQGLQIIMQEMHQIKGQLSGGSSPQPTDHQLQQLASMARSPEDNF